MDIFKSIDKELALFAGTGGGVSSEAESWDLAQLEPWSVKHIQTGYSCSDRTMEALILSQYGMMCEHSDAANADSERLQGKKRKRSAGEERESNRHPAKFCSDDANPNKIGSAQDNQSEQAGQSAQAHPGDWWQTEPDVGRVANGVAFRMDRLKGIGNGQVPASMAGALSILSEIIREQ